MRVHVDDAGSDVSALRIDDQIGSVTIEVESDCMDLPVLDDDIHAPLLNDSI